ncbi:MAG TPA: acetyl-CoA carboxylase biotin carboxyl carrier protein subunit [Desulfobacterales bacterium]
MAALLVLLPASAAWGAFGDDIEKPSPQFQRQGEHIADELIPRAKSTAVRIEFAVAGARLVDVAGLDFEKAARPEFNVRKFRLALFEVRADGLPAVSGRGVICAPIPGRVQEVLVRPGSLVTVGQVVARMEAMKMENNIVSPVAGTVREVRVQKGAEVATGDVLIVIG